MDHPNQIGSISETSNTNIEDQPGSPHPEAPNRDEYGCKYCAITFSTKQALGGHYNAHKRERAREKIARESNNNHFGYYGGAAFPGPHLGTYYRPFPVPQLAPQPQHGVCIGFPGMPLPGNPYYPPRPLPGFNNVFPGWAPGSRAPWQGAYNPGRNIRFPGSGSGSGSSSSRPVDPDLSVFAAPGNNQQDDESGLDLSLKL